MAETHVCAHNFGLGSGGATDVIANIFMFMFIQRSLLRGIYSGKEIILV